MSNEQSKKIEEAMEWNMGESFFEYVTRLIYLDKLLNNDPLEIEGLSEESLTHFYRSVGIR